jgi:vibriolysin
MRHLTLLRGLGLVCLAITAACSVVEDGSEDASVPVNGPPKTEIAALPGAHVVDVDSRGTPRFLAGDLGAVDAKNDPHEVDLGRSLEVIAPIFKASPEGLVLRKAQSDNIGDQHFRYRQVKNGRDVIGGEIVVHVRKGLIYAANGSARDDLDAPLSPVINTAAAITAALEASQAEYHANLDASDDSVDLGIDASADAPLAYKLGSDRMDLVYKVEVQGVRADQTPFRDSVLVNAIDGTVVGRMPHIHTAKNREMHNLNHGTSLPGPLARTEGAAPSSDVIVNDNYDRLGTTYDCYFSLFGRDSYNGAGVKMISSVHYSNNYVNAYWDGVQMVYGDGDGVDASNLAQSMDVTAHELTHAVTENESNLIYSGESGGLNEAMSDIFGNTCEWFRDGKVVSANTWKVGEDIWTPGTAGDALRYMNDPPLDGGSLDYWTPSAGNVDVHYSSGIANLAFYLLSQGGLHPRAKSAINVAGIGIDKASQIFYRANRDILTASSDFAAAKLATEQAAAQLGYTAAEIASVTAAWQAVGVGIPAAPPIALANGVAVTGIGASSGAQKYYSLVVPSGATGLSFTTSGGTGDSDLYVRFGSSPTFSTYDCRPYTNGNAETCTIANVQAGTYYVMLNAYSTFSGVTLKGAFTDAGGGTGGTGGGGGTGGAGGGGTGTGHLVINEVEYDETGTDNREFVEIYNGTDAAVSLSGYSLVLVNGGTSTSYLTQSLSAAGTLAAGQYLVVGNSGVTAASGALKINLASGNDKIQNGAPDGVALISGGTLVDALSYEGSITAAVIAGVGTVSLVEGTVLASSVADSNTVTRSLCRYPNGTDTDNASADWALRSVVTPGSAN